MTTSRISEPSMDTPAYWIYRGVSAAEHFHTCRRTVRDNSPARADRASYDRGHAQSVRRRPLPHHFRRGADAAAAVPGGEGGVRQEGLSRLSRRDGDACATAPAAPAQRAELRERARAEWTCRRCGRGTAARAGDERRARARRSRFRCDPFARRLPRRRTGERRAEAQAGLPRNDPLPPAQRPADRSDRLRSEDEELLRQRESSANDRAHRCARPGRGLREADGELLGRERACRRYATAAA